ncbi:MAG: LCP family protein [Firmicutes bacterium]|nr:LCP family protein [Bacillota bacterium]
MSDDRFNTQEHLTREEAYEEYLRLRQGARKAPSVTSTPYGASELRKRAKEQEAERQRKAYLEERERSARSKKKEPLFRNADRRPKERRPRKKVSKKGRGIRIALVVLIVLVLALGGIAVGVYGMAASTLNKIGRLDIDRNALEISPTAESNLKQYTNIAVLGVDARDVENDSDSRSDAIVIVSINNDTNEVKMFSVFRDTLLDLGGDVGLDKVTHAYFYGGAENTLKALNKNMDLNIERVVVINWKTVAEIIDTLGGIKIDVQESEIEEMNKYIPGTAKTTGSEKILIDQPGKQTLNGAQAVTYARIRKDAASGDYRRNERMKIVMKQTFKKAKKADLLTLKDICDNAFPQAKTNISTSEMMSMGLKFKKYDMTSSTTGWPYDVEGWMGYAGAGYAWYGPPVTLSSNVSKLYDKFFDISDYEPTETVRSISESISVLTGLY